MTASVPSVWPNSFHLTSQVKPTLYSSDLYEPALSSTILQLNILLNITFQHRRGYDFYLRQYKKIIIYCITSMIFLLTILLLNSCSNVVVSQKNMAIKVL